MAETHDRPPGNTSPASARAGVAAATLKAPPALFVSGLELMVRVARRTRDLYGETIDRAVASALGVRSHGSPYRGSVAADRPSESAALAVIRETLSGLVAFVVPGPDPYSLAQGVSTPEPGGLDAGILPLLIDALDRSHPSPPGAPPASALVTGALNQVAQQVNPAAAGPFTSPFACLPFADKARVFQALEANTQTLSLASVLPLTAFLVYSEAGVFDRETRSIRGWPVGWRLSSYEGVAEGHDDFLGYYQGRRSVETSPQYRAGRDGSACRK